jgi:hypothetical protein
MTTCLRCEQLDDTLCQGKAHHGYMRGCQCDACEQLERAIKAGELTADDLTIAEHERSMQRKDNQ